MQSKKRLGDFFRQRKEKGKPGLPLLSVTMNNGLVHRDTLDRKTDSNLAEDEHLLIKKGDIAYNMMRMWQGASGLADRDGMVSPAYVVVAPTDGVDPLFASYWFKSPRMIYLFWAYSYGITGDRLRLYPKDFSKVPAIPPILSEQKRIAALLRSWDRAIGQTEKLIAAKRRLKQGLMQQLLTGKHRFPEFGEQEWQEVALSEVATVTMGSSPPSTAYNKEAAGLPLIQGNADVKNRRSQPRVWTSVVTAECRPGDILMSVRAPIGEVSLSDHHACIGRGMCAIRTKNQFRQAFLYQALLFLEKRWTRLGQGSTFSAINSKDVKGFLFRAPSNDKEQLRIADVLNTADSEARGLHELVHRLQLQKRGLMQQLLTGKVRVKV